MSGPSPYDPNDSEEQAAAAEAAKKAQDLLRWEQEMED